MTDQPEVHYRSEEMHQVAMQIRYDLTSAQTKLTELIRQIALVEPVAIAICATCGYRPAQNMPSLAEHAHIAHGGPQPPHWADDEADGRAAAVWAAELAGREKKGGAT